MYVFSRVTAQGSKWRSALYLNYTLDSGSPSSYLTVRAPSGS